MMPQSRPGRRTPVPARTAGAGLLVASLLAGCVIAERPVGPPPHAPAYGARGGGVVLVPPPVTVTPTLVVVAGTQVAYASNWPEDLFYYGGRYYRPYRGNWYWSVTVGGQWAQITVSQVPRVIVELPRDYRKHGGGPPPWAPAHGRRGKKWKDKDD